jgi:predicted DNA-binding transcriptional regulator YafY
MFHLARISTANQGENIQARHHNFAPELDQSFDIFKRIPVFLAKIRFSGTAAELVKRQIWHKEQLLESSPDGTTVLLTLPISDDREIKMKILQYGAQATVEAPPHLAQAIRSEALLISANYTYCPV